MSTSTEKWPGIKISVPYVQPNGVIFIHEHNIVTGVDRTYCRVPWPDDSPVWK